MDYSERPRLGFFKFSCCAGCEFEFAFFQPHIVETIENFDITYCRMLSSREMPQGHFDIALVEGTITESWQVDELKEIRKKSKRLFAIGSCAVNGGIPAIKAVSPEYEVEGRVYNDLRTIHSIRPHAVDAYVPVDGYIRGCPPGRRDIYEALTSVLMGKQADFIEYSVCMECKVAGNLCLLVADKAPCMGPVTNGGCGALCPSMRRPCYSCYGPMRQANAIALARKFEQLGLSAEDIIRKFSEFGADTIQFRKAQERYRED